MTTSSFGDFYFDLERQRQLQGQYAENSGRLAESAVTITTDGIGAVTQPNPMMFDAPFTQVPVMSYGYQLNSIPNPTYWQEPRCSGGVARWRTDPSDPDSDPPGGVFYLGFYPFVTVQVPPQPLVGDFTASQVRVYRELLRDNPPVLSVTHQFSFSGEAYKELPGHVDEGLKVRRIDLDQALSS